MSCHIFICYPCLGLRLVRKLWLCQLLVFSSFVLIRADYLKCSRKTVITSMIFKLTMLIKFNSFMKNLSIVFWYYIYFNCKRHNDGDDNGIQTCLQIYKPCCILNFLFLFFVAGAISGSYHILVQRFIWESKENEIFDFVRVDSFNFTI